MRRSFFKYFAQREWADAFLEGSILFRSLAYFRDYEDAQVRGDPKEGASIYRPDRGLVITNHTNGKTFTLADSAHEATAKQAEIFVYCVSRSLTESLRDEFKAVACIEIFEIRKFCMRVERALPPNAKFLAGRVDYYDPTIGPGARWALPDQIALSKMSSYSSQKEFRLCFTVTDAFEFEKVANRIVIGEHQRTPNPDEHLEHYVEAGSLRDICTLHTF